jgi:hypothetical protein
VLVTQPARALPHEDAVARPGHRGRSRGLAGGDQRQQGFSIDHLRLDEPLRRVIIGVAAVVTMMAVGAGARARVEGQIRSLGSNLIIVLSGSITTGGVRLGAGSQITLTEDDARAMEREIDSIQVAAPLVRGGVQVIADRRQRQLGPRRSSGRPRRSWRRGTGRPRWAGR